jgi:K+-transporting ATPase ATPase B chain
VFVARCASVGASTGPLARLNVMVSRSRRSAVLSAIVYSVLIIPTLVPAALRDVGYRPPGASALLCRNLAIYGVGGLIAPVIGISMIALRRNGVLGA